MSADVTFWMPATYVRAIDVELQEFRESRLSNARKRFKIEEDSLNRIRASIPTSDDEWVVERILQYGCLYGIEQWLVK